MAEDPRKAFMALSGRLAQGETITDSDTIDEARLDDSDPRKRFIRDSQLLAAGKSLAQVRRLYDAPENETDPRKRFIADSRRLAEGEELATVARRQPAASVRQVRNDAVRRADGGRLRIIGESKEEEDDPRAALLEKLAALARK